MRKAARWVAGAAVVVTTAALAACSDHEFEPPDPEARINQAEGDFPQLRFDTVTWASDSLRILEGNVVYSSYCRNCHGTLGEGGTEYALQRELDVPSLVEPDWRWAAAPDSIRHRIWVGHVRGMPTWGITGLTVREIDAVTGYLLEELRPEILDGTGAGAGAPG